MVIHAIFTLDPFKIYSSPFLTALVFMPATSDPALGSVTQYAFNCEKIKKNILIRTEGGVITFFKCSLRQLRVQLLIFRDILF